jgi:predicted DNA-binding transcriptional regulator AlpA
VIPDSRLRPPATNETTEVPMPTNPTGVPLRYLRTSEAARIVGLSFRTLEKHRTYGTGPRYSKLGGRVVYRLKDLLAWVELGAKTSTSDPGVGTVLPAKRHASLSPGHIGKARR